MKCRLGILALVSISVQTLGAQLLSEASAGFDSPEARSKIIGRSLPTKFRLEATIKGTGAKKDLGFFDWNAHINLPIPLRIDDVQLLSWDFAGDDASFCLYPDTISEPKTLTPTFTFSPIDAIRLRLVQKAISAYRESRENDALAEVSVFSTIIQRMASRPSGKSGPVFASTLERNPTLSSHWFAEAMLDIQSALPECPDALRGASPPVRHQWRGRASRQLLKQVILSCSLEPDQRSAGYLGEAIGRWLETIAKTRMKKDSGWQTLNPNNSAGYIDSSVTKSIEEVQDELREVYVTINAFSLLDSRWPYASGSLVSRNYVRQFAEMLNNLEAEGKDPCEHVKWGDFEKFVTAFKDAFRRRL